jgi:hypothetical protein
MFHSEAYRTGLAERGFCGVANVMTVWATPVVLWLGRQILWLRRHIGWESPPMDSPPIMLDWAARLSARLPTLFDLCPVNPLRTQSGMTLTGAELAGLRDGSLPPSALTAKCPTS